MKDLLRVKIYYEDTDCGGVVYYANYLKYFERARTEFLLSRGIDLKELMGQGIFFVVAEASLKYLSPGRYGDMLVVGSELSKTGPVSLLFSHQVLREGSSDVLVEGTVKIACVGSDMRPMRLPKTVAGAIEGGAAEDR